MTDRESFLKHIAEAPIQEDRWARMLVYADWLEEHDQLEEAQNWRYMANRRKSPTNHGWYYLHYFPSDKDHPELFSHVLPLPKEKDHAFQYLTEIQLYEWAAQNMELELDRP